MNYIKVCKLDKINTDSLIEIVKSTQDSDMIGCIVCFMGIVKKETDNGVIDKLHMDVDERTERKLKDIADNINKKYDVVNTLIYHNLNDIKCGEPIVYVSVSARYRIDAFKAVQEIVDRIKNEIHAGLQDGKSGKS
ncbi:MAG: hypothetical protein DRO92_02930 [Candidatus Altiarchaeales archaeon]|nr:MAG: hypothetical protein DRO92_02930 [Candidatus Altiarchaeales archaeon]